MRRRILHVTPGLVRGGIETWLMHVLRAVDRVRYPMDLLALAGSSSVLESTFEEEFRDLGSRVIPCRTAHRPWRFARDFADVMRRYGPYDVVHAHVHHYSGFILRLAAAHGVPVRIAHSHNDTRGHESGVGWRRRLYRGAMEHWIRRYATHRIAVSREAAEDLFGPHWARDDRSAILHCGLDFSPFAVQEDRVQVRRSLGLPPDAPVIGHIGRFSWRKNHAFLLEVAAEAFARDPRARLLSLGEGPLMEEIRARAHALGIAERIVFAGSRDDVPRLMRGAMDAFVLPSHHEGLSLAVLEAQAAGLPCVLSDALTAEGDVVPELIHRLPLSAPPGVWAEALLRATAASPAVNPTEAYEAMSGGEFGIRRSVSRLLDLYGSTPDSGDEERDGRRREDV